MCRVVATDLHGYGATDAPTDPGRDHSMRARAHEQAAVMRALGHEYDPLAVWAHRAADVRGHALAAGHFLPEAAPGAVVAELRVFLGTGDAPRLNGRTRVSTVTCCGIQRT